MDKVLISGDIDGIMNDYVKLIVLLISLFIIILTVIQLMIYLPKVSIVIGMLLILAWLTNEIKKLWNF